MTYRKTFILRWKSFLFIKFAENQKISHLISKNHWSMKILVRFFALFLMAVLLFSCVKEEYVETGRRIELTAQMEVDADSLPGTKTHLGWGDFGMRCPVWYKGDEIAVYDEVSSDPQKFTLSSGAGTETGTFSGNAKGNNFIGFYPYQMAGKMSNGSIPVELPQTQNYVGGSFGNGNFPMMATGDKDFLKFRNLCALMQLSLKGTGSVLSITVSSNDKEMKLSGRATAKFDSEGIPQLTMLEGGSDTVVLDCGVVDLQQDRVTDFYIVIPAQTYKGGLQISINGYMDTVKHNISSDLVFERSEVRGKEMEITLQGGSYLDQVLAMERAALIEFYHSTNGDNWVNNTNWCSDKPVGEWYGVRTDGQGRVIDLSMMNNCLSGVIPESICNLQYLESIFFSWGNNLTGEIPGSICNLKNLRGIFLADNNLTGSIPENIGNLSNLRQIDLSHNNLTGSIPESFIKLVKLQDCSLFDNMLSGKIPESFKDWDLWNYQWRWIVFQNNFRFEDVPEIDGPKHTVTCVNGKIIDMAKEYKKSKYTILYSWAANHVHDLDVYVLSQLRHIHEHYSKEDVNIISWTCAEDGPREMFLEYINMQRMLWDTFIYDDDGNVFKYRYSGWLTVVDSTGRVVYSDVWDEQLSSDPDRLIKALEADFKLDDTGSTEELYESTDYSSDGIVRVLQQATIGNGIDVVLMGDGYSDRLIADGTYDRTMDVAYEKLFEKEPYKSFKEYFNVYSVYAVSKNEVYTPGSSTALDCDVSKFSTIIEGNSSKVISYANLALGSGRMENATIVVAINERVYAGTCFMNTPSVSGRDWAEGMTISYVPIGEDDENFGYVLHHEAAGHGFAKLADEYAYEYYGYIDDDSKQSLNYQYESYGWWKNVDVTGDPAQVKWKKFLQDTRYANEGLGVFEGGYTYWKGVWRPSETSIMVYNTGEFNAPSREAIYYRIHKLAYGPDWEYDYEKFVEYDAINRNKPQTKAPLVLDPQKNFRPTAPPVVVKMDLRELMNQGK